MIQALIGPLGQLASTWLNGRVETKAAETEAKVATARAKARIMEVSATSEADWEKVMAEGSKSSWKDEFFSLLLAAPCVIAFTGEAGREIVREGFIALDAMPEFYRYFLGIAIASSFGIRGAAQFIGRKK